MPRVPSSCTNLKLLPELRNRRLVRVQWHEETSQFGESQVEILPTLRNVIPFDSPAAWEQQTAEYQQQAADPAAEKEPLS